MATTNISKKKLLKNNIADYSFLTAFFLVFSFFVFFAIKPNLETAVKLNKELTELRQLEIAYNNAISRIVAIQTELVQNSDNIPLLDAALPENPEVNKVLSDVQKSASTAAIPINELSVAEVPIKETEKSSTLKDYVVNFQTSAEFPEVQNFLNDLQSQRRLKLIKKVNLSRDIEASTSADLQVSLEIQGYYL